MASRGASYLVSDSRRWFSFADSLQGEGASRCVFLEAVCDKSLLEKESWPGTKLLKDEKRADKQDAGPYVKGFVACEVHSTSEPSG